MRLLNEGQGTMRLVSFLLACAVAMGCGQAALTGEAVGAGVGTGAAGATAASAGVDGAGAAADADTAASESVGPAADIAAPSNAGKLKVEGTQLVSESGEPVQLRGVSTHGLAWFPGYVNQDFFNELRSDWGANVVRLALYTAESGGYCADGDQGELMQLVDNGVAYATEADLYVIVDWHILSDTNPLDNKDAALAFFDAVSARYADHNNVIYEICNEPNGSATWDDVKAYANEVIPVIRANDPDALVIVGTPTWSQDVDVAAASPLEFDNVMYTLHFYAATHKDDLRAKLQAAHDAGLPVFVTEFGICDASGNGQIDYDSANAWVELMDSLGVSYVCWNLSNKDEASALFNAGCAKTMGFATEDLSAEGLWLAGVLDSPGFGGASAVAEQTEGSTRGDGMGTEGAGGTVSAETAAAQEGEGGLSWQVSQANSWEADGKTFVQYQASVINNGTSDLSGWEVTIDFTEPPELSDGWNGVYTTEGNSIVIRNADYNGLLAAGASAGDIGFIVSGSADLALASK